MNKKLNLKGDLGLLFVFCMSAAVLCSAPAIAKGSAVVAQIGGTSLTLGEIHLRQKQQSEERAGSAVTPPVAYRQLHRALTGAEILKKFGRPVTPKILEQEDERIRKDTLMPDKLRKIRALFPDSQSYRKLYVLPVYVNRVIYFDFFANEERFHARSRSQAEALMREAQKSGKKFSEIARSNALRVAELKLTDSGLMPIKMPGELGSARTGLQSSPAGVPANVSKHLAKRPGAHPLVYKIRAALPTMKVGDLFPLIAEQNAYLVLRLNSGDSSAPQFEGIFVPKASFDEWFKTEAQNIRTQCFKPEICAYQGG